RQDLRDDLHAHGDDLFPHPVAGDHGHLPGHGDQAIGFRKSTGSSRPSHTTVARAGSVRATTFPFRTTSLRGATSRMASISLGAANAQRSARQPTSSP